MVRFLTSLRKACDKISYAVSFIMFQSIIAFIDWVTKSYSRFYFLLSFLEKFIGTWKSQDSYLVMSEMQYLLLSFYRRLQNGSEVKTEDGVTIFFSLVLAALGTEYQKSCNCWKKIALKLIVCTLRKTKLLIRFFTFYHFQTNCITNQSIIYPVPSLQCFCYLLLLECPIHPVLLQVFC